MGSRTQTQQFVGEKEKFVMEKGNTKQEILDASLELFSVQGFEAER